MGKSRLVYELKRLAQGSCRVLEAFSLSHGQASAYLPLIELLQGYFGITPQDDGRRVQEKVTEKVLGLDQGPGSKPVPDPIRDSGLALDPGSSPELAPYLIRGQAPIRGQALEETLPYLLALLGVAESMAALQPMEPRLRRQRTFEAIERLLVRESLHRPLLVLVEDLHWIDEESQAGLERLAQSVATARILLVGTYRLESPHPWSRRSDYTQVRLAPLGPEEAQELLTTLLGEGAELQGMRRLILSQTRGNPFFMEEIVQALFDQGVLVREAVVSRPRPLTRAQIPPTVQGVLAARLDRLPAEEKALVQALAVIGTKFPLRLIERVVDRPEEDLSRLLSRLQGREFVYEHSALPEPEYVFKHALTQEVAYHSLLQEQRRELHERTGRAIEALFAPRLEEHCRELAHHYSQSGNVEKAVDYLLQAGRQAVQRSAFREAIGHLTRGLELIEILPDTAERAQRELDLQMTLAPALMTTKGFGVPEVEQVYLRIRELGRQVGGTPQFFPALRGLWSFHAVRGELQAALEPGEELLELAQRAQDPTLLLVAHEVIGYTLFCRGEPASAGAHCEQAIALYESQRHHPLVAFLYARDSGVHCRSWGAVALWMLGYPDQALERSREALALARELSQPTSLSHALLFATFLHILRRERETARERAAAMAALSTELGFAQWLALVPILQGLVLARQGQAQEGIAQMRQGLAALQATGVGLARTYFLGMLAGAYGEAGEIEEGLKVLAEALALGEKNGERFCEAELYRLKGELLLALSAGKDAGAEACFRQALDIAQRQGARSWELRAAISLSRLQQQQGRPGEGRQRLAEVYGWFTEGFDTPDLQEARALLEGRP